MGTNTALILQLILLGTEQLSSWAAIVNKANAEGRDVTDDELNQASAEYQTAHNALDVSLKG